MDFGNTLKKLLSAADVKVYHLAAALGYDKSYLSKWINGVRLPPARNVGALSEEIADFVVKQTGAQEQALIISLFDFPLKDGKMPEADSLTKQISRLLKDSFWNSYRSAKTEEEKPQLLEADLQKMNVYELTGWFLNQKRKSPLEFAMVIPATRGAEEYELLYQMLSELELSGRGGSLDILMELSGFYDCPQALAQWIFKILSIGNGLKINLYEIDTPLYSDLSGGLFVMNGALVSSWVAEPFSGEPQRIKSVDISVVNAYWAGVQKYILAKSPVLLSNPTAWDKEFFKYQVERDRSYFLNTMFPLYMDAPLINKIMSPHFPTEAEWQRNRPKYLREFLCARSVIIYESAIVNYLMNGILSTSSRETIKVSPQNRREHILQLIGALKSGTKLELKLLKDLNPVLKYRDTGISYFRSDRVAYFVDWYNPNRNACFVTSRRFIDIMELFMGKIEAMSSDYLLEGSKVTDFLRNSLELI